MAPLVQRPTLPDLELIERHFQKLLSKISPSYESADPSQDSYLDLKEPLFDLSLELTTEFLLGEPEDWSAEEEKVETSIWANAFAKEFKTAFSWISKRERLKGFYWMIDSREFRGSCRAARRIVDQVIERSMQAIKEEHMSAESYIALEPLLRDQANVGLIRDQFLNLLLAGRDTSGSLLCWMFYALSREPELVKSLKAEMTSLLGPDKTRKPTKNDLNKMTLLDQFISESKFWRLCLSGCP